jgi:hypothetical protein
MPLSSGQGVAAYSTACRVEAAPHHSIQKDLTTAEILMLMFKRPSCPCTTQTLDPRQADHWTPDHPCHHSPHQTGHSFLGQLPLPWPAKQTHRSQECLGSVSAAPQFKHTVYMCRPQDFRGHQHSLRFLYVPACIQ